MLDGGNVSDPISDGGKIIDEVGVCDLATSLARFALARFSASSSRVRCRSSSSERIWILVLSSSSCLSAPILSASGSCRCVFSYGLLKLEFLFLLKGRALGFG
jgi:hypothetical protein